MIGPAALLLVVVTVHPYDEREGPDRHLGERGTQPRWPVAAGAPGAEAEAARVNGS